MALIIDMASGTEYQGDYLRCQSAQEISTTNASTSDHCKQSTPGLQLVKDETTSNSNNKSDAIICIDFNALFESNNS